MNERPKIKDSKTRFNITIDKDKKAHLEAIADELGMELVLEDMEFDSVVISVGKHGVDLGMAALTVNETRKKSVNFSSSYYNAAQVLVTLENDNTFQSCKTASDVLAALK